MYCGRRFILRRGAKWLGNFVFGLVILAALFVFLSSHFFGWRFDGVFTGSMEPTFNVGGVVVIRRVDPLAVERGDIITYKAPIEPDLIITHRVVEVINDGGSPGFRTKGDGNIAPDDFIIPQANILGKASLYIPLFGDLVKLLKTPLGFILCLIVPGALLIWGEGRKIAAIIKSKNEAF